MASSNLTARELDVLRLICEGKSAKEIGNELGIASKTVEFHRTNICAKVGETRNALVVRWAIRAGIIEA